MAASSLLALENVSAAAAGRPILRQVSLSVAPGTIHAIVGRNGSGKSSLAQLLTGHPNYTVTEGRGYFYSEDLFAMPAEVRAAKGLFLAYQNPVAIPGVANSTLLKTSVSMVRKARGLPPLSPKEWLEKMRQAATAVGLTTSFLRRSVNLDFSGGEKKRNELLQMKLLEPTLAILDEIDSGLDAQAFQLLVATLQDQQKRGTAFLLITHYPRLLELVPPHAIHFMHEGTLITAPHTSAALAAISEGYQAVERLISALQADAPER